MQEKVKTPKQPVKGFVTVELFDKYGDKIQTVRSHNIIRKPAKDHMIWDMKEDFFRGCPGTLPSEPHYCFNNIVLSTATTTPQESGLSDTGVIIGWANKTAYSGSDVYRGTINTSESYATNDKVHWVFDWPTHAANGTFQTILWGNISNFAFTAFVSLMVDTSYYLSDIALGGGYYWLVNYGNTIIKMSSNYEILGTYSLANTNLIGITWGNNFLWVSDTNGNKIHKINPENMSIVSSFSAPSNTVRGLAWYNNSLWVVCSSDNTLYELNPATGTVISSLVMPKPNVYGVCFDNNGNIFFTINDLFVYKMDRNTGNITSMLDIQKPYTRGIILNEDNTLLTVQLNARTITKVYDVQIGARTLLPQPVTKTSTNTMKVQYDFIFED